MKVKLLQGLAGAEHVYRPGDIGEFNDEQAKRLIDAKIAVAVEEKATKPAKKGSKGK